LTIYRSINALAESFFASLKGECLDQQPWPTRAAARRATVDYIAWYNGTRLHSALGYMQGLGVLSVCPVGEIGPGGVELV
jgi:transposase InsO family protein